MAPVRQVEGKDGELRLQFTGAGYALLLTLLTAVGGGAGFVGARTQVAQEQGHERTDSREWQMAERDRVAIRREVTGFREEMTTRFDRLERMLAESQQSAAYCCARVNALERRMEKHEDAKP